MTRNNSVETHLHFTTRTNHDTNPITLSRLSSNMSVNRELAKSNQYDHTNQKKNIFDSPSRF
jgi:hypothetical protein